jgi:uncharacterized protein YraI
VKQSLAWLWLIGAVLYAVSVWRSADTVNIAGHKGQTPESSSPAIATPIPVPITESPKSEQLVEARTEPIAPQSSLDPDLSSSGTASEQAQKAEAASAAPTAAPTERFVVRSAANIRNGPSPKSTLIGTAPAGAELDVAEREGGWVRFIDPATSHTGWIYEGILAPVGSQSVSPVLKQQSAAPVNTASRPRAKVRNPTRTVSGGAKQRTGDRPYALGYARNPSAEEFGANTRRFGFFARRRMVREGLLGTD